jgi:phage terminase large subunit-like protein
MRQCRIAIFVLLLGLAVSMFSDALADRAVYFWESMRHVDGQFYNQPFILLPWEKKIIRDVYGTLKEDGTRQYEFVWIEVPKKNGKSELAAPAALYHTFGDGEQNGEIYGCAADKKQARIIYKVASKMIELVPALSNRARVIDSMKTIIDRKSGSVYEVLSAEAFTKHGFKTSACVFDEIHAQPNRDLWDVMTYEAGASRRQPIWWVLTTAGDDPDRESIGWELHEYALKVLADPSFDPTWYVVIFNYEGDDIYNEANWYKANPSLGVTKSIESMREAAKRAKNKPANERLFRWLDLNQWITTKLSTWQPLELFEQTVGNWDRADLAGKECYVGMDLSTTTDLSCLCGIFPPQGDQQDWRVIWDPFIPADNMAERIHNDHVSYDKWEQDHWITATPGNIIDYLEIYKRLMLWKDIYKIIEIDADRAFATMLIQMLEKAGLTCVDVPQTFVSLNDALNQTEILLKGKMPEATMIEEGEEKQEIKTVSGKLLMGIMTHEPSPVAKWCFGNTAVAINGQGFIKYVKEHKGKSVLRTKRIDCTAAWITGMARARFYKGSVDISAEILSPEWGM